jgi:hypothetical protein
LDLSLLFPVILSITITRECVDSINEFLWYVPRNGNQKSFLSFHKY